MRQFADEVFAYLQDQAPLLAMVFDDQSRVSLANAFASQVLGQGVQGRAVGEVFVDFHDALSLDRLASEPHREHLLHVNTPAVLPQSFLFRFQRRGGQVLALGRQEPGEAEALRQNLHQIAGELSNLNREVSKRNAELAWLNEQKNRFLGMAAHDLRSPIGHISSCSQFLLEEAGNRLKEPELEFLNIIRESSVFMLGLIDDILDLSAIESGRLDLNLASRDLVELLRRNVHLNGILSEKKGISLILETRETLPTIIFDQAKIQQVMNNLISNAIKYSPAKSSIMVSCFKAGAIVTVAVKDRGPGIPVDEINKLFQPFSKTSVRAEGGEKSTGLGLSIAHRIVTGHGGRMWVDSRPGQGSTFYFTLPIQETGEVK